MKILLSVFKFLILVFSLKVIVLYPYLFLFYSFVDCDITIISELLIFSFNILDYLTSFDFFSINIFEIVDLLTRTLIFVSYYAYLNNNYFLKYKNIKGDIEKWKQLKSILRK